MQYKVQIHNYVQNHKDEIVETLKELIKIPSVRSEAEENAPFGKECARLLRLIEQLYKDNGFETELDSNGGYLLSYYGKGEKTLGIFAHADVVPVGDDWIYTPFEPIEKDGFLIGRGVLDNKAGVVISLFCAKLLKELNIPFNSRLVMFTGSNEESGMQDIKNYLSCNQVPDFSFVPDTAFPLYRGNKGTIRFSAKSLKPFSKGVSLNGGTGATVIGSCEAILPFSEDLFSELLPKCNDRITVSKDGENIKICAIGISKHSAIPEGSLNAVALISDVLKDCSALNKGDRDIFNYLYNMSSCHYGEFFGIENNDGEFGKLTCVMTGVETNEKSELETRFNIRYGSDTNKDTIINSIEKKLNEIGFSSPDVSYASLPDALARDNKYVEATLNVFKEFTLNQNANSYINAGGTYRQYLKKAVETGPTLKWGGIVNMPQGHGGAHQPDEYINIDGFLQAIEITALMLLECDKTEGCL
jgi:succinyl-diaminopimelate desuccinylase